MMPAIDEAKTFSETRLQESMEACEPVQALRSGRGMHTALEMHFISAPLILTGAGSSSKISGKPIRYLFLDEEKDMRKGAALPQDREAWLAMPTTVPAPRPAAVLQAMSTGATPWHGTTGTSIRTTTATFIATRAPASAALTTVPAGIVTPRVLRRGATVSAAWIAKAGDDHWALNGSTPSVVVGGVGFEAVDSGDNRPSAGRCILHLEALPKRPSEKLDKLG
jgi:hypothetical protein